MCSVALLSEFVLCAGETVNYLWILCSAGVKIHSLSGCFSAAEIGDFLVDEYVDISYLSSFDFLPKGQQTVDMLHKVMDYHRQHV